MTKVDVPQTKNNLRCKRGKEDMLDNKGFDLWAGGYEESVDISENEKRYPFAGYKKLMRSVFDIIMKRGVSNVLDIGIGTGILSTALYKNNCKITGIDFSQEMLKICREKMPEAKLLQFDFVKGLPAEIKKEKYDFIISTYALHHLDDNEKVVFINELQKILDKNGSIIIGDIGFQTKKQFEKCKKENNEIWDNDEYYFIFEELKNKLAVNYKIIYNQISVCAFLMQIEIKKDIV